MLGSYLALNYAEDIIEHKFEQTVEGYGSDTKRQRLIAEAFIIGLENPLFGLGHDGLHEELPNRVHKSANAAKFDSHNLLAYLFGGAGFPTFLVFMLFIGRVFFLPRLPKSYQGPYAKEYREAYFWARTYVVLFMVRGIFTREILYSPTFLAGLGLVLSYWYYMYRRLIAYQKQSA